MSNKEHERQRATVRAWISARDDGESQASFCARQQPAISTRTLRSWMRQHALGRAAIPELRRVVVVAIQQLQQIVSALDDMESEAATTLPRGSRSAATGTSVPNGSCSAGPNLDPVRGLDEVVARRSLSDLFEEED